MTDETGAPASGSDTAAPADTSELSLTEARELLFSRLDEDPKEQPDDGADDATAEPELSKDNSDPETDPAEDAPEDKPEDENLPPIERPRSWTKDVDTEWQSLPRNLQERIAAREQERDAGLRRSQNEAAEIRKAAEAERDQLAKLRQEYEAKLPALDQKLKTVGPFADIKSIDDLRALQQNDPFRFQEYQVYLWETQAEQAELQAAEQRKATERQTKRSSYEAEQNKELAELVPEMADPKKAVELRDRAVKMLTDDLGLKIDQLSQWMQDDTGHEILSNARIQKLIADGVKYRDLLSAPKAVATQKLPPVQRPGVSKPAGQVDSEHIQALEAKLNQTGSEKDAWALYQARMKAQSRRAS